MDNCNNAVHFYHLVLLIYLQIYFTLYIVLSIFQILFLVCQRNDTCICFFFIFLDYPDKNEFLQLCGTRQISVPCCKHDKFSRFFGGSFLTLPLLCLNWTRIVCCYQTIHWNNQLNLKYEKIYIDIKQTFIITYYLSYETFCIISFII